MQEAKQAIAPTARPAAKKESIQKDFERIVIVIQGEPKLTVRLMIALFFFEVSRMLAEGAIAAAMAHYAPAVLGESPQAAKKEIQAIARVAVGSAEILAEYRYVSTKVLIARQNPKARSPARGWASAL